MENNKFLGVTERKELVKQMFETLEDHGTIVRCLKQLIKLPDSKLTKSTLLDLLDSANSISLNWDYFIEQNKKVWEKN